MAHLAPIPGPDAHGVPQQAWFSGDASRLTDGSPRRRSQGVRWSGSGQNNFRQRLHLRRSLRPWRDAHPQSLSDFDLVHRSRQSTASGM
jgi:hypothetical protein